MLSRLHSADSASGRNLIKLDRLREIFQELKHVKGPGLPSIVVIGDQSAGKSSVLEALSGVALPRAAGTCTRCPCELRMKHVADGGREYAELKWRAPGGEWQTRSDIAFDAVGAAITDATQEVIGGNSVSTVPLYLTVYKKGVPDLTLIDLPGIVTVAADGQDKHMPENIERMIKTYINEKTAIILNVMPVVEEWQARASLRMANEADPNQARTVIAASKCDKFEPGTANKLRGVGPGSIPCKLGIIAVRARTQAEIDKGTSFEEARANERAFFEEVEELQDLPPENKGMEQLACLLADLQSRALDSQLPDIMIQVENHYRLKLAELQKLPEALSDAWSRRRQCAALLSKLRELVRLCSEGEVSGLGELGVVDQSVHLRKNAPSSFQRFVDPLEPVAKSYSLAAQVEVPSAAPRFSNFSMYTIARLVCERSEQMQKEVHDAFSKFLSAEYGKIVAQGLKQYKGSSLPNFLSFPLFRSLVRSELEKLREPCMRFVDETHAYLSLLVSELVADRFKSFPQLRSHMAILRDEPRER